MTEGVEALPALPVMPPRSAPPARTAGSAPGSTSLHLWGPAPPVLLPGRRRQRGSMVEESPGLLRAYSAFTPGCWLAEL